MRLMRMTRSLRGRLTITTVGVVAAVLLVLAAVLYLGVRNAAWRQHDDGLAARARALAAIVERERGDYEVELPPEPDDVPASYIELWRPDGGVLDRSESLHDGDLPAAASREPVFSDITLPDGRPGRAVGIRFAPRDERHRPPVELTLVLAEGTEHVDAAVATVRTWFIVFGLAALLVIAGLASWSLGRGLRPLSRLAAELERIDDRKLATRLPVDGQPAELVAPVRKLNELFARLDASFARERQFTSDVSHELRTPIAGLRTLLEVTALADREPAEYRAAIASAHQIALQLGALVENLLMLARLDAGQIELANEDVELRALVDDCWRPHATLAASRSLELRNRIPAGTTARTDREKLRLVIGNLLSNAAEYTAAGGWIEIAVGDGAVVSVTDSGPAIPPEHLARIFDRLWRGDVSRSSTGVHCGIGLSLARSLCGCLGFSLTAASSADGVSFRVAAR